MGEVYPPVYLQTGGIFMPLNNSGRRYLMAQVFYVTREEVKAALDFKYSARSNGVVDQAIASGSRAVEGMTKRKFYPVTDTRYFPWPDKGFGTPWRLWLNDNEVISVTTLTSGGTEVSSSDYFLEPINSGPPYNRIEIDLASSSAFQSTTTHQRAIAIEGVFGYSNDETNVGGLVASIDSSQTTLVLPNTFSVGVGSVIRIGTERMIVTERTQWDTSQTLQTPLTASQSNVSVVVEDGTDFYNNEVILIDSERMLITDILGNTLTVKRAWDGTVLTSHSGASISKEATYTVERGALGTTAASHTAADDVFRWDPPSLIKECAMAEAINNIEQASSAYARVVGQESNEVEFRGRGLEGIRMETKETFGRKARIRGVG